MKNDNKGHYMLKQKLSSKTQCARDCNFRFGDEIQRTILVVFVLIFMVIVFPYFTDLFSIFTIKQYLRSPFERRTTFSRKVF